MKTQINPTIKAYLIRGAFYVILLLAAFVISLALGQQSSGNSVIDPTKDNRMAIGWREINRVSSNFRQSGYGASKESSAKP
jgi:hypothetical protein